MHLFRNCGLFWNLEDVFFGEPGGRGAHKGQLLGEKVAQSDGVVDFRDQIGVYALYADFELIYVGQVGGGNGQRLLQRLRQHANGEFRGRWNRFSWFGLRHVLSSGKLSNENDSFHPSRLDVLNHVEGIILQFAEPPLNGQEGRFREDVIRYQQVRDPRLGMTMAEKINGLFAAKAPPSNDPVADTTGPIRRTSPRRS